MSTKTHDGGFAPETGWTLLRLLSGAKGDCFDTLAGEALQQMLQASILHARAEELNDEVAAGDLTIAWIFASGALRLISDEIKHFDFFERDQSQQPFGFEPSGSMSGFANEESVFQAAKQGVALAVEQTKKHAALMPAPVEIDFMDGSTDLHAAMDLASGLLEGDKPQNFHLIFITDGEPTPAGKPTELEDLGGDDDDDVHVRAIEDLPELLAQRLKQEGK